VQAWRKTFRYSANRLPRLSASELSLRPLVISYLPRICLALIASIQQFQLEGLGAGPQGNRLAHLDRRMVPASAGRVILWLCRLRTALVLTSSFCAVGPAATVSHQPAFSS